MTETSIAVGDGTVLCVETFGDPADPTVLLIAGGGQSMIWWDDELCRRLAAPGRHVVRYDHRDTGRSTSWPAGQPGYTGADLAADPLGILDALDVDRAHVVGMSMGGGIAQRIGVEHLDRVRTLTLVATSPTGPGDEDNGLPPIAPSLAATFDEPLPDPDWDDIDAVVTYRTEIERPYAGSLGLDVERVRVLARREVERTTDMAASLANHFVVEDSWSGRERLGSITVPTLVLHGTDDPFLPLGHGEALAREIPGARLLPLDRMGHEIPPPRLWDPVVAALTELTSGDGQRA